MTDDAFTEGVNRDVPQAYVNGLATNLRMFTTVVREADERLVARGDKPLGESCDIVYAALNLVEMTLSVADFAVDDDNSVNSTFSPDANTTNSLKILEELCLSALVHVKHDHPESHVQLLDDAFDSTEVIELSKLVDDYIHTVEKYTPKGSG